MKDLTSRGFNATNRFYTIAEIGINHGGDVDLARSIIDSAARSGVDSVKFQTYITEKRVSTESPIYNILKKCELPFEAFAMLKEHAEGQGVEFFSTPFDDESIQFLEDLGVSKYKVASFDVVNHTLLRRIAETGKTVIMSVGMANISEVNDAYGILKEKTDRIAILHCVSAYPTNDEDANLASIYSLKEKFDCVIGHSDHTNGIQVPLYAAAAGAQIIEKHFMINNKMDCVDAAVSITEVQMSQFIKELDKLDKILGQQDVALLDAEKDTKQYRRHSIINE